MESVKLKKQGGLMSTGKVLLTGGTGFLGSRLGVQLLRNGHKIVFLARGDDPLRRIKDALAFWGNIDGIDSITVIRGDVSQKECGVVSSDKDQLRGIDHVWHCAATLDFALNNSAETIATNVGGTTNLLQLVKETSETSRFNFVSTAYVCGKADPTTTVKENDPWIQPTKNPYEESKRISEEVVRNSGLPFAIFRPSVIIGDTQTGKALALQGYYTFLRVLWIMKKRIVAGIRKEARRYLDAGITYNVDTGTLHLPVRLSCRPNGTINIVPVDDIVQNMLAIAGQEASGGKIFHLTNAHPPSTEFLFNSVFKSLLIEGTSVVDVRGTSTAQNEIIANVEKRLREMWEQYLSYIFGEPQFDKWNVTTLLDGRSVDTPITEELMEKLNRFAISEFQKERTDTK